MGHHDHGVVLGFKTPDDPQNLAGELRIQSGGGFVKTKHLRAQSQGTGNGHPLLLSAGELIGIAALLLQQTYLVKKLQCLFLQGARVTLLQKLGSQHHVFQHGVLGKQVEILEHQAEMKPVLANLFLRQAAVVEKLAIHPDFSLIRSFQEIQAAKQGGLAAAGGTDNSQHLPLFQRKTDASEYVHRAEALFDILYFQNCHGSTSEIV